MANIKQLLAIQRYNKSKFQGYDYERMVIRDGNNKFRIVDDMPFFVWEHWFTAADGTPVHSVCTRDYKGEMEREEDPKYCDICELVKNAWSIWNDSDEYSQEEVSQAGIIIGKEADRKKGFPASWGAKQFAYMNVIDRQNDWCAENNHTKVLSKSEKQAGISSGHKGQLDEFIECVDENGDWLDYDIRVKKSGKKLDTVYRVYKDKKFDLPEEEVAYERYDFKELLKPTKAETINRWLTEGVKKKKGDDEQPSSKQKSKKAAKKKPPEVEPESEEEVDEEEGVAAVKVKPAPKRAVGVSKKKKKVLAVKHSTRDFLPEPEPEEEEEEEEEVVADPPPSKKKNKLSNKKALVDIKPEPEEEEEEEEEVVADPPPSKKKSKKKALINIKPEPEPEPDPDGEEEEIEFECPTCEALIKGDVESCAQCGQEFGKGYEDGEED